MSAHKFNPAKLAKLNHPDRYHRENPEAIWKTLNLADPRVIVDIGAGTGFFAIPFSRYMPEGVVYACDIADEMLEWLEKNLPAELQGRVIPVKMEERSVPLAAELADLVLMVNLHHELEDAAANNCPMPASEHSGCIASCPATIFWRPANHPTNLTTRERIDHGERETSGDWRRRRRHERSFEGAETEAESRDHRF